MTAWRALLHVGSRAVTAVTTAHVVTAFTAIAAVTLTPEVTSPSTLQPAVTRFASAHARHSAAHTGFRSTLTDNASANAPAASSLDTGDVALHLPLQTTLQTTQTPASCKRCSPAIHSDTRVVRRVSSTRFAPACIEACARPRLHPL